MNVRARGVMMALSLSLSLTVCYAQVLLQVVELLDAVLLEHTYVRNESERAGDFRVEDEDLPARPPVDEVEQIALGARPELR